MHVSRFAAILLVLAACSGSSGTGSGPGGSSGSATSTSSGGTSSGSSGASSSGTASSSGAGSSSSGTASSSGSTGSSGGTSSSGVSSSGASSSGSGPTTLTLTMGPFTVPPATEVFKCQTFANPFGGQDTDIAQYDEQMTEGSHHMFLFFMPGATDGAVEDCPNGGLEYHPYPFSAQTPQQTLTYPQGVGSRIPGSMGFMLNAHFINVTTSAYQATLTVTLHVAAPGSIQQYAGVMFMNNLGIVIPPTNTPVTASATCTIPQDMTVMASASHMHQRATDFVATSGSQTLYTTQSWSAPIPAVYNPPLQLSSGSTVTFSCSYTNETSAPLTFGESAQTNVMCIYSMQFYPISDPSNPTITCMTQ